MHTRFVSSALLLLAVAGCESAPTAVETPITFRAIGAYNAEQWLDASVPGSESPRPGTQLPIYLVCGVDGDENARGAAVLMDAQMKMYENGSAELTLSVGTWLRRGGVAVASSETITRWGDWTEGESGRVTLSGFNLPGLGQELRYTELGSAELPITLACPNGSSDDSVHPTLTLTRQTSAQ